MSEQHNSATYQPPVSKLLTIGECQITKTEGWPDYRKKFGLTEADIPELIRMMSDGELWESEKEAEPWSVIHAWRALGQLKAVEAIAPLLSQWDHYEDDDWLNSETPSVFQLMGIDALPVLAESLASQSLSEWARSSISEGVAKIGEQEPEHRDACLAVLIQQLEAYNDNPAVLNGMLVAALLDLNGVEAIELIEQVYVAKKIDDSIPGTWATVQIELGLKQASDFAPADLQHQFFKNMQAARLIANPNFENGFGGLAPDWSDRFAPESRFSDDFLNVPQQSALKPAQGFGKGSANAAEGNKKKKKKQS